jgi:hypothetical protein
MEYMGTRHVVDPRVWSSGSTVPFAKRRVRGRPALAHAFAPVDTLDFQGLGQAKPMLEAHRRGIIGNLWTLSRPQ